MAEIKTLYLFVHFVLPEDAEDQRKYVGRWEELIRREGPVRENALCVLTIKPRDLVELDALSVEHFGDRCFLDPCDDSEATKALLGDDLKRTLSGRGRFTQWSPYEMWTSVMARRWTEGLRREMKERGHTCDPAELRVVSTGQQWGGCLTKYSMLMPRYLGVTHEPTILVELCQNAGWPVEGARFVERVPMDRHVSLYLFETADGRPMGQFMDGLRGIWERPHVAVVDADDARIELLQTDRNGAVEMERAGRAGVTVANVVDGCRPRQSTLLSKGERFESFKALLSRARIEVVEDASSL